MVIETITSRQNPLVKILHKLAKSNTAYRKTGCVWLEGEHLLQALAQHGAHGFMPHAPLHIFLHPDHARTHLRNEWMQTLVQRPEARALCLDGNLWADISQLNTPCTIGALLHISHTDPLQQRTENTTTVVLDRIQDAGNVGSILRSASAFGFRQVIALKGTAALWSSKVLRAGMGAHFNPELQLIEQAETSVLEQLEQHRLPLLATSSHQGQLLHQSSLPTPCAWLFGNEGQGLSTELTQHAVQYIRIAQPGGEESLNAAAAAAICLHASAVSSNSEKKNTAP